MYLFHHASELGGFSRTKTDTEISRISL